MTSTSSSVRQRRAEQPKKSPTVSPAARENGEIDVILKDTKKAITSEWDYKLALVVITALAFLTRFWGIGHPNEVVFDEVHFGKVRYSPVIFYELLWQLLKQCETTVCFVLLAENLFFRCSPSIWETALCPHGLVCRI